MEYVAASILCLEARIMNLDSVEQNLAGLQVGRAQLTLLVLMIIKRVMHMETLRIVRHLASFSYWGIAELDARF